jgi:DNA (cytosine-5)-methyltransferase 1
MNVGEMFAGIGGFRLGLERTGHKVIWANEWNKYAATIYRKNFGETELKKGDIHKIETNNIPDIDILCAGFPCQAFSVAGKRQGFKDIRGTLFFEVARIAEAKRPKLLLLENVKGLLNHDNGDTF